MVTGALTTENAGIAAVLTLTTFQQQEFAAFGALLMLLALLARERLNP